MIEKIKFCPFCGAKAELAEASFGDSETIYYRIWCEEGHGLDMICDTPEDAIREWNKRIDE